MLPYPSGTLHIGHIRNYSIGDALARYKWMRGFNVLHPMGWDAFGLPAENAAIANKVPPREWTLQNIAAMKKTHRRFAFSYDWDREVSTCEPEYYRWNQWFFLQMLERGLAYRKRALVNWCSKCATVLANEQVVDGCCWRHEDTPVEQRALEQWFLKITDYADELLDDMAQLEGGWPERVLTMQRNWIGRSEGTEIDFHLESGEPIRVFTTRVDTIYGATCVILAPEHPLNETLLDAGLKAQAKAMVDSRAGRDPGDIDKEGLFTGRYAVNPYSGEKVPIWIANFVLMGYGTGAIMAVPAHDERDFEFCRKYDIPVRPVIRPVDGALAVEPGMKEPYAEYGILENSGEWSGLPSAEARRKMSAHAEAQGFGKAAITYRLKDWGISRQRYWGTPIPVIHCPKCGVVPVPENQLPVILPDRIEITGAGRSPLENVPEFVNVHVSRVRRPCPPRDRYHGHLHRLVPGISTATAMRTTPANPSTPRRSRTGSRSISTSAASSTPSCTSSTRASSPSDARYRPHPNSEPARRLFTQGMVIAEGAKMSKSKGNVVGADMLAEKFGADTARMFVLFAAPPEKEVDWRVRRRRRHLSLPGPRLPLRHPQYARRTARRPMPTARSCANSTRPSTRSPRISKPAGTSTPASPPSWNWSTSSTPRSRVSPPPPCRGFWRRSRSCSRPSHPTSRRKSGKNSATMVPSSASPGRPSTPNLPRKTKPRSSSRSTVSSAAASTRPSAHRRKNSKRAPWPTKK